MSDEIDALWPSWMVEKRDQLRAEREKRTAGEVDDATRRLERECSVAELERQRAARTSRKPSDDDALFYRPARFGRKHAGSV